VGASGQPQNCQGDSGGPAFLDFDGESRLVGTVSRGPSSDQSDCSQGGIDSRVDPYLEWISDRVELPCGSGLAAACPVNPDDPQNPDDPENPDDPQNPDDQNPNSPDDMGTTSGGCSVGGARHHSSLWFLSLLLVGLRRGRKELR
jgi:hypothetical protein